jgi:hypothetical protein
MLVRAERVALLRLEYTIVDYYGGFLITARPPFLVYGSEAFERRLVHAP